MKDLIIIGAGPIGLSCGIEAKKNNLEYLIIDKGMLVTSIFNYPANTTFFSTSSELRDRAIWSWTPLKNRNSIFNWNFI